MTINRLKTFEEICYENFNVNDSNTLNILTSVNEQDQAQILHSLTSKLYAAIMKKVDDIDYGTIPLTRGDITRLQNYDELLDCCTLMKDIIIYYKQNPTSIQIVIDAIDNIRNKVKIWEKSFNLNIEFVETIYNTIVLSIVSSISFMITTCIEYITHSDNEGRIEVALDKIAYSKTKDHLLFTNLNSFNKSCIKGDIDRVTTYMIDSHKKNLLGAAGVVSLIIFGSAIAIVSVIPFIRELIYFFYLLKQNIADYFEVQADLLQINAANLEFSELSDEQKEETKSKQLRIVETFRKISNKFAIKFKKAENDVAKEINSDKKKYNIDEVIDEVPGSASPDSIF